MNNQKSPLEVIYDEILETQDLNLVFRWIETHGFTYEKNHLKDMYFKGFDHAQDETYNPPFARADDTYHQKYPNIESKIYKP
jgi:hypothetical protein